MATVYIGHSARDENGKYQNGQAGDQTGREVCKETYYNHKQGWVGLRAKDGEIAELIAQCMEDACANDCIGYDQNQRLTLYDTVRNLNFKCDINTLKVKVECDCSSLVRVCLAYAGVHVGNFNTSDEKSVILGTGMFIEFTVASNGSNLKRGDILVTKTKGHTIVILSNGDKVLSSVTSSPPTNPTTNTTISTKTIGIAVAKTSMTVRNNSNKNSTKLGYISKGKSVEVIEVLQNGWYKIKWAKANCGYAYTSNVGGLYYTYTAKVNPTTSISTKPINASPTKTIGIAVARTSMKVRSKPNADVTSKVIDYVSKGDTVEVIEILSNGWYKIECSKASCGYGYTSNVNDMYYTYTTKTIS